MGLNWICNKDIYVAVGISYDDFTKYKIEKKDSHYTLQISICGQNNNKFEPEIQFNFDKLSSAKTVAELIENG